MSEGASVVRPRVVLLGARGDPLSHDLRAALADAGLDAIEDDPPPQDDVAVFVDFAPLRLRDGLEASFSRLLPHAAGGRRSVVLLLATAAYPDRHARDAAAARLRAIALAGAPGLRINAIGTGSDAAAIGNAVRLVVDAPTMVGQLLWLQAQPHVAVHTSGLAMARAASPAAPAASDALPLRHVFVRDLLLSSRIGVYRHEQLGEQRIRINIDLGVSDDLVPQRDRLTEVVCYDRIVGAVRQVVAARHVALVETLAEQIAAVCLEDPRVAVARVRVEKLDIYADAESAGVEIERRREICQRNPTAAGRS